MENKKPRPQLIDILIILVLEGVYIPLYYVLIVSINGIDETILLYMCVMFYVNRVYSEISCYKLELRINELERKKEITDNL
jgi:hypothetical protein